jgi:hypothetical protein
MLACPMPLVLVLVGRCMLQVVCTVQQQQHNQYHQCEVGAGDVGIDAEYAILAEQQYETVSEEFLLNVFGAKKNRKKFVVVL